VGEAIPLLEQSLALYRELGDKVGQASTIDWLSINNSDLERATTFAREGLGLCRELGDLAGVSIERDLEVIHPRLNESDFARLSTEGQRLTVDEAVGLALEELLWLKVSLQLGMRSTNLVPGTLNQRSVTSHLAA